MKFKIVHGIIISFTVPSENYRITKTGNISVVDAIEKGEVCTGDGCGYRFTKEEIKELQDYLAEQKRIDEEFDDFCQEQGMHPDDPETGNFLQNFIDIQKKLRGENDK